MPSDSTDDETPIITAVMGVVDTTPVDHKPGAEDPAIAEAIHQEHELTFMQAVKLYPAAVGWSAFVSIGVIMSVTTSASSIVPAISGPETVAVVSRTLS